MPAISTMFGDIARVAGSYRSGGFARMAGSYRSGGFARPRCSAAGTLSLIAWGIK